MFNLIILGISGTFWVQNDFTSNVDGDKTKMCTAVTGING